MTDVRRTLPSVSALLDSAGVRALLGTAPRSLVVDAVRDVVAGAEPRRWSSHGPPMNPMPK